MTTTATATKTEEHRQELLDGLAEKVEALRTSEGWTDWLTVAAKFHRYSVNNQMLIEMQNPDATHVTGYGNKDHTTGWLSLGRQVRKGEQSIRIYAPIVKTVWLDAKGEETTRAKAVSKTRRVVGFKLVPVFDISQTDGDPLPESPAEAWRRELGSDEEGSPEHYQKVKDAVTALGFDVREWADPDAIPAPSGSRGWWEPGTKVVNVVADTPGRMAKTTLHELAHAHDEDYDRAQYDRGELVAESVSFLLANELGLKADGVATTYLAGWSGETDKLTALANRVLKISRKISDALFPEEAE